MDLDNKSVSIFDTLKPIVSEVEKKTEKKIRKYKVVDGDSLEKIAKKYKTDWKRIFYKNKDVKHPDQIKVGDVLVIPYKKEKLVERSYVVAVPRVVVDTSQRLNVASRASVSVSEGNGNFEFGWCTWYAQSQRPDRKFGGNAGEWIKWANGNVPKVGAVAVNTWSAGGYGHVAIVKDFNDSQVLVSHMNYRGFGVITTDWIDRSYFSGYIY